MICRHACSLPLLLVVFALGCGKTPTPVGPEKPAAKEGPRNILPVKEPPRSGSTGKKNPEKSPPKSPRPRGTNPSSTPLPDRLWPCPFAPSWVCAVTQSAMSSSAAMAGP